MKRNCRPWALALVATGIGPALAAPVNVADYDQQLCTLAQRTLVNADAPAGAEPFSVSVLFGVGSGFHNIQMDVDAKTRTVVTAMTTGTVRVNGQELVAHVGCKMVNRDRVNDVLGLKLTGPLRSCRDINEFTYRTALDSLSAEERRRYEATGKPLRFADDQVFTTGGEWLRSAVDDFIRSAGDPEYLEIRAPSVRVPWNPTERNFFQGTHHCKLITLTAMRHWMRGGALSAGAELLPRSKASCKAPSAMNSTVGSCVFYFSPAEGRFCQDYSGPDWTPESARAECGKRHASIEAQRVADNRYAGAGGIYSAKTCAGREDARPLTGTCVFHCQQSDETLWHTLGPPPSDSQAPGAVTMMNRACDLFLTPGL